MKLAWSVVFGAIWGGLIGPLVGAIELIVYFVIVDQTWRSLNAIIAPVFLLPFAYLIFAAPAAVFGAVAGYCVHLVAPHLQERVRFVIASAMIGAVLGTGAIAFFKVVASYPWSYLALGSSSGFLTGIPFALWLDKRRKRLTADS